MPLSATPGSAPPGRTLFVLALAVLLAHGLVLSTRPARMGQAQDPASKRAPAFVTRSIAPPPPVQANAPPVIASPAVQAIAKTAPKPVFKKKEAVAPETRAQPAINSIAEPVQKPIAADVPAATADRGSAPTPSPPASDATAANADTASAAAPPASAPAAAPAGPSQTPVTAMALPASAQLDYAMSGTSKGLVYSAKGELAWRNAGGSYDARMTVSALFLGSRTLSSTGQLSDQGLAPTRFSDKSRSEVAAHFEPDKGQISFSANTPAVPWVKGSQDRVSIFLQLGGMLAGKPADFPVGSTVSMLTVGPRDADNWTFRVEAEEKLTLPFGELETVKLSRQPRREYDQKVEVWYAPALGYLPVRSKITQANGDFVDQQLRALTRP